MTAAPSTTAAAAASAAAPPPPSPTSAPPWQVRWKRPRWDTVALGIRAAAPSPDPSHHEHGASHDHSNNNGHHNNGHADDSDDEYEVDGLEQLGEGWIPVSSASVALTREEARTALLELYRRGELLVRRRRRTNSKEEEGAAAAAAAAGDADADAADDREGGCGGEGDNGEAPTSGNGEGGRRQQTTPRNKNPKSYPRRSIGPTPPPLPLEEGARATLAVDNASTKAASAPAATAAGAAATPQSPRASLTSPSSWFKSITSPGHKPKTATAPTNAASGKPPRATRPGLRSNSPASPTLFSTFAPATPPPKSFPVKDGDDSNDSDSGEEEEESPPAVHDASTASSLLWEDMTLTSVSEADAAAFRKYGSKQHRTRSKSEGRPTKDGRGGYGMGGEAARKRLEFRRWDAWDGYDHAVLAATIYATRASEAAAGGAAASAGEAVVLEVLSTRDPPLPSLDPIMANEATTKQSKISTSSSGSSLTSPSSAPPPPPPASSATKGGSAGSPADDDSTSSATGNTKRTKHSSERSPVVGDGDDEEDDITANRTRILARRVLRWPSSVRDPNGNLEGRPSFVSLGRSDEWRDRRDGGETKPRPSADVREQVAAVLSAMEVGNDDGEEEVDSPRGSDSDGSGGSDRDEAGQRRGTARVDGGPRAADAVEAFRALNFLFGGDDLLSKLVTRTETAKTEGQRGRADDGAPDDTNNVPGKKRRVRPLSLCLVAGDGTVHLFYALRVLLGEGSGGAIASRGTPAGLSHSFASFLLGSDLFARVTHAVMPLSRPRATVRLSQLAHGATMDRSAKKERDNDGRRRGREDDPPIWETLAPSRVPPGEGARAGAADDEREARRDDWARLGAFDASIDPTSLPLRTVCRSNVLTGTCVTSDPTNGFLAVCGKGLRRVPRGEGRRPGHVLGGFVTFVSLRHGAEARTVYLPFAPERIQPVHWSGMHFVVLLGEEGSHNGGTKIVDAGNWGGSTVVKRRRPCAMATRVDCKEGGFSAFLAPSSQLPRSPLDDERTVVCPSRFHSVAIDLPLVQESLGLLSSLLAREGQLHDIQAKAIAVSSIPSSPPGIVLSFQCRSMLGREPACLVVVNHTLCPFQAGEGRPDSLSTFVRPGHRVPLDSGLEGNFQSSAAPPGESDGSFRTVWCTGGQGWSLVGIQGTRKSYFICWDGATDDSQGPFILPFQLQVPTKGFRASSRHRCLASDVMPLLSHTKNAGTIAGSHHNAVAKFPSPKLYDSNPPFLNQDEAESSFLGFTPKRSFSITLKESIKIAAESEGRLDEIFLSALDSISATRQSPESRAKSMIGGRRNRTRSLSMSHKEKSRRILRQCSSWTQLDDSKANHGIVQGQVIVATIRLGTSCQSLTLRTNTIANPISTPFNQVLSWLCQRKDYFTAASVALSLLDDPDAVYDLCGIPKSVDEELSHHKGLLDGITPLHDGNNLSGTMISLADMAVACLIKGGVSMSKTLEGFLERNALYDAPRACLMLVGSTAAVMSKEPTTPQPDSIQMGNIVSMIHSAERPSEELIWPVRCLIKMAVVRNSLPSTILMLNATIPNELRWRTPKTPGLSSAPRPSLGLFLALVDIVLGSTEAATRLFLNTMDEETGMQYWQSIDEDAKLALSLVSIHGKLVMLLEAEVRTWVLGRLKEEIESPVDPAYQSNGLFLPDEWLQEVVAGVFCNAECDIGLGLDALIRSDSATEPGPTEDKRAACYRQEMLSVRNLLIPKHRDGLDLDLLIASLLVLARRDQLWREGSRITTQTLLNSVCEMAGKKTDYEPKFTFDGATVMRQCALSENVQAAAFLVGGRNGFVLECADLVVSKSAITMKEVETAVFAGSSVDLQNITSQIYQGIPQEEAAFSPTQAHHHLTWLLQTYVLDVHTYGDFVSSSAAKIDPVFAGRVCFRTWYCLTHPLVLGSSAEWLEGWLRRKLKLSGGKSPKRLACAALVRALLWADQAEELEFNDGDGDPLLAALIRFDGRFMAELARACCGLIQAVPSHAAEEIMSTIGGQNIVSFEAPLLR